MGQKGAAFIVAAVIASSSAHTAWVGPIVGKAQAIAIADKSCGGGDFGKSFAAFPWHAQLLGGRTWQTWKEDGERGTLSENIDAVTGKSGDCLYSPCSKRTVCGNEALHVMH